MDRSSNLGASPRFQRRFGSDNLGAGSSNMSGLGSPQAARSRLRADVLAVSSEMSKLAAPSQAAAHHPSPSPFATTHNRYAIAASSTPLSPSLDLLSSSAVAATTAPHTGGYSTMQVSRRGRRGRKRYLRPRLPPFKPLVALVFPCLFAACELGSSIFFFLFVIVVLRLLFCGRGVLLGAFSQLCESGDPRGRARCAALLHGQSRARVGGDP